MQRIIFDIETIGNDPSEFDAETMENLLKNAKTEEDKENVIRSLGLHPLTGEIIAIGMLNPDTNKGYVHYQDGGKGTPLFKDGAITYQSGTEQQILQRFWLTVKSYSQVVTFNGRTFDCPFIAIRSAVHKIQPTRDLMPYRYSAKEHLDLMDMLTFYGATRKFSLDMWCKTLGIESPKSNGIKGSNIGEHYKAGKYREIAKYCIGDVTATAELLRAWSHYIQFPPEKLPEQPNAGLPIK